MIKYLILIAVATVVATLTQRYNRYSWWICCILSTMFFLWAIVIASPIIAIYFCKETLHTGYKSLVESLSEVEE